ncbi:MAG: hypothetical protein JSU66_06720 [Deltaproteobacteria bacterium]|nr:MAG: hypothetical protein JSU66_06720 [Deltaproteobacteria bacterium]
MTQSRTAAAALISLLLAGPAVAERIDVWIASGLPGGTYRSVYARNLEKLMPDYKLYYRPSSGSGENLEMLAAGDADLAFAQADVYAAKLAQAPERFGGLVVLGALADECVYIAHRRDGPVRELGQLGEPVDGRPARIALGAVSGGMAGTWGYLTMLNPKLTQAAVDDTGDTLALNQLAVGAFDAVGWVTDPDNYDHKMLRAALANDALALMPLKDPNLVTKLHDGTRVYDARKVKLADRWNAPKLETLCTQALVLVRDDADPKLLNKVADLVGLKRDVITGRAKN